MSSSSKTILKLWGANALGMAMGVFASGLLARILKPEEIGTLALVASLASFFFTVFISWLLTPFVRFGKRSLEELGSIGPAWKLKAPLLLAAALCVTVLASPPFLGTIGPSLGFHQGWGLSALVCFGAFAMWSQEELSALSQIYERFDFIAALQLGQKMLWLLALATIFMANIKVGSETLLTINWAVTLVLSVAAAIILWPKSSAESGLKNMDAGFSTGAIARHCLPQVLATSVGFFSTYGDHWLIRLQLGLGDVGQFQLAYQVFSIVNALALTFSLVFLPRVIREESSQESRVLHNFQNVFPLIHFCWLILILVIDMFLPEAFSLVYTARYAPAIPVLMVLMTGTSFSVLTALYSPYFHVQSRLRLSALITVLMVVLNLTISWFLLPILGLLGSALGTSLSYWLAGWLYLLVQQRSYKIHERSQSTLGAFVILVQISAAALFSHFLLRIGLITIAIVAMVLFARNYQLFFWIDFKTLPMLPDMFKRGLERVLVPHSLRANHEQL